MLHQVSVIPSLRLPRQLGFFDYTYDDSTNEKIKKGQFVTIPFKNRECTGVVMNIEKLHTNKKQVQLKSISTIRHDLTPLLESEISYILNISRHYCVSPSTMLHLMYPLTLIKLRKRAKIEKSTDSIKARHQLPLKGKLQSVSFHYQHMHEASDYYKVLVRTAIKKKEQLIIVTPTLQRAKYLFEHLSQYKSSITLAENEGIREQRSVRTMAQRGDNLIFIGARYLLGIPYSTLKTIIIDQSEHQNHKLHLGNPLIDNNVSAVFKASAYHARIIFSSCAPRLEEFSFIPCTHPKRHTAFAPIVINMHDEFRGGNVDFISQRLQEEISSTLFEKKSVVLYLNHKGGGKSVVCKECKYVFICPSCQQYLRFSQKNTQLHCLTCKHTQIAPDQCPHCHGVSLLFLGLGIEKIAQRLSQLFSKIPIFTLDSETTTAHLSPKQPSIIVATSRILYDTTDYISSAGLIACIATDPIVSMEQFRAVEGQWQEYAQFFSMRNTEATCLIQVFNTDVPFIQTLKLLDYHSFANNELAMRKKYHLPPFTRHILCTFKGRETEENTQVKSLCNALQETIDFSSNSTTITLIPKSSTRRSSRILIQITAPYDSLYVTPEVIHAVLMKLSADWMINPDPRIL
ncbi:MAG: hypothetical protein Q8P11_01450 [bacterium]|nr:hypothetical protein [bacterium]